MNNYPEIPLWASDPPSSIGQGHLHEPRITVHLPTAGRANGCGVLIAPGGGYRVLASDHEGLQVARAFNRIGVAAFVLRYRVAPTYSSAVSLLDGQRAIRLIRHNSKTYGISRLGMLGFSAGGHLTSAVGTSPHEGNSQNSDPIDRESSRPDFLVLAYAVTNGIVRGRKPAEYTPTDIRVDSETPPTFFMHTHEDAIVSTEQSLIFYKALHQHGVPAEMHVFGRGEHGIGLGSGDPDTGVWFSLLHKWIRRLGFLTSKERMGICGQLTINGAFPGSVWITFEPDDPDAPSARVRIDQSAKGRFNIDRSRGPTAGPHVVSVRHVSNKYPLDATGDYTLHDEVLYQSKANLDESDELVLCFTDADRVG